MDARWGLFPFSLNRWERILVRIEPHLRDLPADLRAECVSRAVTSVFRMTKRRAFYILGSDASLVLSLALVVFVGGLRWGLTWTSFYVFLFVLLVAVRWIFLRKQLREAIRAEMSARGYHTCHKCGYPLKGQDRARCPECGAISFELIRSIGVGGLGFMEDEAPGPSGTGGEGTVNPPPEGAGQPKEEPSGSE